MAEKAPHFGRRVSWGAIKIVEAAWVEEETAL
jgi:hypothetical protein